MTRPLSEVLADLERLLTTFDWTGNPLADLLGECRDLLADAGGGEGDVLPLTHEEHERLQALIRGEGPPIPKRLIDLLAEHNGPTWEPSSSVLLTLPQAERIDALLVAPIDRAWDEDDKRAVRALRHGIECAKVRCGDPKPDSFPRGNKP